MVENLSPFIDKGCTEDSDCKKPHSYCDKKKCDCEQHQCPNSIENGELGCKCCHIGFDNVLWCNKGYTVAHPDYIIYW